MPRVRRRTLLWIIAASLVTTFVLPGEALELEAVFTDQPTILHATAEGGELQQLAPDRWRWTAPQEPGAHCISVKEEGSGRGTCLNAFVMKPYNGEEQVN